MSFKIVALLEKKREQTYYDGTIFVKSSCGLRMIARDTNCDMLQTHMSDHGVKLSLKVGTLLEVRRDDQ